jgi:hypothetical protein
MFGIFGVFSALEYFELKLEFFPALAVTLTIIFLICLFYGLYSYIGRQLKKKAG